MIYQGYNMASEGVLMLWRARLRFWFSLSIHKDWGGKSE